MHYADQAHEQPTCTLLALATASMYDASYPTCLLLHV